MKRMPHFAALFAVGGLVLLGAPAAHAAGPPVVHEIQRLVDEESVEPGEHPCTGQPAELTLVQSGVIHFAAYPDGTVHFTGTLRGTFSADALPTDGTPDATGTVTVHFGGNGLLNEDGTASGKAQSTFTLNGRGTNADGSTFRFHENRNTVFDPNGVPKLELFKSRADCS